MARLRGLVPVRLTSRGLGLLLGAGLSFAAAWWSGSVELLYVCGALSAMVVSAAVYTMVAPSRLYVSRSVTPGVVESGGRIQVTLRLVSTSPLPLGRISWRDRLPAALSGVSRGTSHDPSGSSEPTEVSYEVTALRRGEHPIGPAHVAVTDPFGLVTMEMELGLTGSTIVLPHVVPLASLTLREGAAGVSARDARRSIGMGEEDVVARPYVTGDAMSRIHWKATARVGGLMARQEESIDDRRVLVILDADARNHGGAAGGDESPGLVTFEWSVSAAASACAAFVHRGDRVLLHVTGQDPDRIRDMSRAGVHDSLSDGLIDLGRAAAAELTWVDEVAVCADVLASTEPSITVAVLGQLDESSAQAWVESVRSRGVGLALVSRFSQGEAVEILDRAGWRVVTYSTRDDVAAAWQRLDRSVDHVTS